MNSEVLQAHAATESVEMLCRAILFDRYGSLDTAQYYDALIQYKFDAD